MWLLNHVTQLVPRVLYLIWYASVWLSFWCTVLHGMQLKHFVQDIEFSLQKGSRTAKKTRMSLSSSLWLILRFDYVFEIHESWGKTAKNHEKPRSAKFVVPMMIKCDVFWRNFMIFLVKFIRIKIKTTWTNCHNIIYVGSNIDNIKINLPLEARPPKNCSFEIFSLTVYHINYRL